MIFVRLLVAAHERAANRIITSPITLCSKGIPEFGLQPTTTITPEMPTRSPIAILSDTLWPSMGNARSTVNTGFMGMINEASPAAVQLIPCMNRSWYAIVPSRPSHIEKDKALRSGGRNRNPPLFLNEADQTKNNETAKAYLSHAEVAGLRVAGLLSSNP